MVRRASHDDTAHRPHRHRVPLGLVLLSMGAITHQQLRHALSQNYVPGERIGEVLARECGLSERKVAEALALQWGCQLWDVRGIQSEAMAIFAPHSILIRSGMVPVRVARDGRLAVAFAHAVDTQAVLALQRIHKRSVDAGIAAITEFVAAHERVAHAEGVPQTEVQCSDASDLVRDITKTISKLQPVETRWARVHELLWVRLWLEPAALAGGIAHTQDVVDYIFHLPLQNSQNAT